MSIGANDAAPGHQLFYVAETQRKPEVEPHDMTDDFCRIAEAAIWLGFFITLLYKIFPLLVSWQYRRSRWIFHLTTCYVCPNGRVEPKSSPSQVMSAVEFRIQQGGEW